MLELHNPHSVLAALETRPDEVERIVVPTSFREVPGDAWTRVVQFARKSGVTVGAGVAGATDDRSGPGARDRAGRRGPQPGHRQDSSARTKSNEGGRLGIATGVVRPRTGVSVEELFDSAKERAGGNGLWIALDSLQDPHNLGAIFRTAAFFGVQGIVMTEERSAPLSSSAYDVASGGVEHVPFAQQTNLIRAFEKAKEAGLWILGTSEHAGDDLAAIQRDRPWLLVLGNEEKGMRRLTEESCDVLCKIAAQGQVGSLNVSVAAGIFISTLSR